jgi:hypothetical protein
MSNARELLTKIRSRLNSYHHADLLEMIDAELAKPEAEPTDFVVIDENGLHIYSSSIKQFCHDHINSALDDDSLFDYAKTWRVKSLYTSPSPMQRLTDDELLAIAEKTIDHTQQNVCFLLDPYTIMDAMIEKNKGV